MITKESKKPPKKKNNTYSVPKGQFVHTHFKYPPESDEDFVQPKLVWKRYDPDLIAISFPVIEAKPLNAFKPPDPSC